MEEETKVEEVTDTEAMTTFPEATDEAVEENLVPEVTEEEVAGAIDM